MKFADELNAHITPEWRSQYINYEDMKYMLYKAKEESPCENQAGYECYARYFAKEDEEFFRYCNAELQKINNFYREKLAECNRKLASLRKELSEMDTNWMTSHQKRYLLIHKHFLKQEGERPKSIKDLKKEFSRLYLHLVLLQNYQMWNISGFNKILKKHDMLFGSDLGFRWKMDHGESIIFSSCGEIERLIEETENIYTNDLEKGNREKAVKKLRVPPLGQHIPAWTTFRVGFFIGVFLTLLLAIVATGIFGNTPHNLNVMVHLYRGPLMLSLFLVLCGINVYGWRTSGVNHVLIFELDPQNHLSEQNVIEIGLIFAICWAVSVLMFLYSNAIGIGPYTCPLVLILTLISIAVNPFNVFYHSARSWFSQTLARVITAPFSPVRFPDFWLAEQLTSLVPVLLDFQFLICFYITNSNWMYSDYVAINSKSCVDSVGIIRPIIACMPVWFRICQCLRRYYDSGNCIHVVDSIKYITMLFAIVLAYLNFQFSKNNDIDLSYLNSRGWMIASIICSCVTFAWDIKVDWGLLSNDDSESPFLREETIYPVKCYYFAMVEDMMLRFGWTLSLSLTEMGYFHADIFTALGPLEMFRRFIWNFFRLENEHLNNCGRFRVQKDISITPVNQSYSARVIKLMDNPVRATTITSSKYKLSKKKKTSSRSHKLD